MEIFTQIFAGFEAVVFFGIIAIVAIGSFCITRKDIRELNNEKKK